MQFPKSVHADGWHAHMPDQRPLPPIPIVTHDRGDDAGASHAHRRLHVLAIGVVALGALAASAGLDIMGDPRPFDVRLSAAMRDAGDTLRQWQGQLSRGLQVSLRAVADGSRSGQAGPERPADEIDGQPAGPAQATIVAQVQPQAEAADRQQPVRRDLAPRPAR
ncbi:hypothetical protein [Roseateles sp.]|uniref:hypothetical protein n=1 Tax=Roseateles sp. TaxID=1971397 RepID=UPI002E028D27|nr:hypothetical protein [Roseateles sp.]